MGQPNITPLNLVARAMGDLIAPLQDKPIACAIAKSIACAVQLAENDAVNVWYSTGLDVASGDALDQWGTLVGEPRDGLPDTQYRRIIKATPLINSTDGSVDELIEAYQILTGGDVYQLDMFPAGYKLYSVVETPWDAVYLARIARTIDKARPAGVSSRIVVAVTGYFGFASDPHALGFNQGILAAWIGGTGGGEIN